MKHKEVIEYMIESEINNYLETDSKHRKGHIFEKILALAKDLDIDISDVLYHILKQNLDEIKHELKKID